MSTVTLDKKTILVTGAAGFIGSNLVKRIYQEAPSATVIGIDNMNAYQSLFWMALMVICLSLPMLGNCAKRLLCWMMMLL